MDIAKYTASLQANINEHGGDLVLQCERDKELNKVLPRVLNDLLATLPKGMLRLTNVEITTSSNELRVIGSMQLKWVLPTIDGGMVCVSDTKAQLVFADDELRQKENVEFHANADLILGKLSYSAITRYALQPDGRPAWMVNVLPECNKVSAVSVLKLVVPPDMSILLPPDIPAFSSLSFGSSSRDASMTDEFSIIFSPNQQAGEVVNFRAYASSDLTLVQDGASVSDISFGIRVARPLLDKDGSPLGPLSFTGLLAGVIQLGSMRCRVIFNVDMAGLKLLRLVPVNGLELPGVGDIAHLVGGKALQTSVDAGLSALQLDRFTLKQVEVGVNLSRQEVEFASLQAYVWVLDVRFDISAQLPDVEFRGSLSEGESPSLKEIISHTLGNTAAFPDIDITDMYLYAKPNDNAYQLDIELDTAITLSLPSVTGLSSEWVLEQVYLSIKKQDQRFSGHMSCEAQLFGQTVQLGLEYLDAEQGWVITASTLPEALVSIGSMLDDMGSRFALLIELPDALSQTQAENLYLEYHTQTGHSRFNGELSASSRWQIPIGPSKGLVIKNLGFSYENDETLSETLSGSISGEAQIAGASLDLLYEIPGALVLKTAIPSLSFTSLAQQFVGRRALKSSKLPAAFFDFTLNNIVLSVEPDDQRIHITAQVDGFGDVAISFLKYQAQWAIVMDFTLGSTFSLGSIHSSLSALDIVSLGGGKLLFANMTTLPGQEIMAGGGAMAVQKGVNLVLPANLFNLKALAFLNRLMGSGNDGGNTVITGSVKGNGRVELIASLAAFNVIDGLRFEQLGVRLQSSPIGLKTSVIGQLRVDIDNPPLLFDISMNVEPGGTDIRGFLAAWESPFGIQGINFYQMRAIIGANVAAVPTFGVSGRVELGEVKGRFALVFDSKNASQSMAAMKFKRLSLGLLMRSLFSPVAAVPAVVTRLADLVSFSDLDLRIVPPGNSFPEYQNGISLDGKVAMGIGPFTLKGQSTGLVDLPEGIHLKGTINPIKLSGIVSITGQKSKRNPKGGLNYELNLLLAEKNPYFLLDGKISFLDLANYQGTAKLSPKKLSFDVKQKVGVGSYTLSVVVNNGVNVRADGRFEQKLALPIPALKIKVLGLSVPVWPRFTLRSTLGADLVLATSVSINPNVRVTIKNAGFRFSGSHFVVPKLTLSIKANDFADLPDAVEKHILKNIKKIFKDIINEVRKNAENVGKEIEALAKDAAKEVENIAKDGVKTAEDIGKETAKLAQEFSDLGEEVVRIDKQAEKLGKDAIALADKTAKYVENVGNEIANLGENVVELAQQQVENMKNIGNTMKNQATSFANSSARFFRSVGNTLNPLNW